jgi:methyl-accepting chemotaxis protein
MQYPPTMSNVIDTLFQSLEDTLESSIKDVETAGKSADRIADGVEEIMSSFDEHEVRACAYLPPRHSET